MKKHQRSWFLTALLVISAMLIFPAAMTLSTKKAGAADTVQGSSTVSESDIAASNSPESIPIVSNEVTETTSLDIEDFPDQSALEQAYVEHKTVSGSSGTKRYSRRINAGSRLTGQDKIVYDQCKTQLQKVADGIDDNDDGRIEAIVTMPASDLLKISAGSKLIDDPSNNRTYITANDLGITQRITRNTISISNQAVSALFNYDIQAVVRALLADCPYDLYWFDKEQNVNRTTQPYYFVTTTSSGIQRICFDNTRSTVSIRFVVSADYAAVSRGESDVNARYTVDASKVGAAVTASANARQIVKQTESEGLSDLQILQNYQQKICELVDYDYDASPTQPYGNAWQMIYVFDNDPSTKVTCEGYAKAMQYLCDETNFHDNSITCASVTGYLIYGDTIASHMWNIVHWTDGNNYLVDVTNCDSGTAGEGGKLFMIPVHSETADALPADLSMRLEEMSGIGNPILYSATVNAGSSSQQTLYYAYDNSAVQTFSAEQLSLFTMDLSVSGGTDDSTETQFSWKESGLNDGSGYTLTIQNRPSVNVTGTSFTTSLPAGKYTAEITETDILGRKYISSPIGFVVDKVQQEDTSKISTENENTVAATVNNTADTDGSDKQSAVADSAATTSYISETQTSAKNRKESENTGDSSPIVVYTVVAGCALLGLMLLVIAKKNHRG